MAPPPLVDDLVEEVLLRLPPDDPASLARSSLVCRPWRRLLSGPAFRRRYRELHSHGAPPLLGYLHVLRTGERFVSRFVSALGPAGRDLPGWLVLDCRHGRALLAAASSSPDAPVDLAVWDPITNKLRRLPRLPPSPEGGAIKAFNGAVLCGAQGCDHGGGDCHVGPFRVVFIFSPLLLIVSFACAYSSESGEWGELSSVRQGDAHVDVGSKPSVLVGDTLYFSCLDKCILEYRLSASCLSVILAPEGASIFWARVAIIKGEDGVLGFAEVQGSSIVLWSRQVDADGFAGWARSGAVELKTLLPAADDAPGKFRSMLVSGFVEGTDVIFVHAFGDTDTYKVQLKSRQVTKLAESYWGIVVPYADFYIPAMKAASTGEEGPGDDASST